MIFDMDPKLVTAATDFLKILGGFLLSATGLFWSLKSIADKASQEFDPGAFKRWIKSVVNVIYPFAVGGKPIRQPELTPLDVELVQLQDGSQRLVPTALLSMPPAPPSAPSRPPSAAARPPETAAENDPKQA